jgi:DnaJ family protein C protein 28
MNFDRFIEEQLRKAREEGKFDNLRGHGQPLRTDENPFEDPAWQMANDMLKKNGFRPDWLEDDVAIRGQVDQARQALVRSRDWRARELQALGERRDAAAIEQRLIVAHEWRQAQERFRSKLAEVNKAIFNLNLKVPAASLQRLKFDIDRELEKLL